MYKTKKKVDIITTEGRDQSDSFMWPAHKRRSSVEPPRSRSARADPEKDSIQLWHSGRWNLPLLLPNDDDFQCYIDSLHTLWSTSARFLSAARVMMMVVKIFFLSSLRREVITPFLFSSFRYYIFFKYTPKKNLEEEEESPRVGLMWSSKTAGGDTANGGGLCHLLNEL